MTDTMKNAEGPLARFGRRVAAVISECNYAQTRVSSLRNTPGTYQHPAR